jgi:pimeloyl-ACP methyl ester carboxylesterase
MKRILLLLFVIVAFSGIGISQNVFNPADPIVRYSASAPYGSAQRPDTAIVGLQKWVAASTNGVSSGSGSFDNSSYKAYYINYFGVRLAFRLKFPKSYTNPDSVNKKYPVMLFMHGAGEVGCPSNGGIYNNEKQLTHGGQLFRDYVDQNKFDGYLLYPQLVATDNGCWGEWGVSYSKYNTIITIIDSLVKYARLDIDRVFVDGLSGGGVACWRFAENYPTRIAKIAPTSAAGLPLDYPAFVHIPIWLATGGKDTNPSPDMALYSETKVTELGGNIRRSLYADLGHSSWYRHWQEPDFVPFMNDVHKANPLIFFNRFEFCPDSGVNAKLGITPGFYAYEWQRDGVTIATRTGSVNTIIDNSAIRSFTGNEITVKDYGTYRVRFRRVNNGPWSDWSPKPAVIKSKSTTQTPPIEVSGMKSKVLPALDGKTTVTLQLPSGFTNYQWVRTTDNVLVSNNQMYEAPIGTYKARYSEPFGCGTLYSPVFKVVSAAGTPKPDEAKNLSVTTLSKTSLRLDWNENPNAGTNETGFEVYRGTKAGGPYTLVGIAAQNVVTYTDTALNPNTKYFYIVRAVAESGAAAASNEADGTTDIDNIAPAAPSNLEYRGSTTTTVSLRWNAASDNVGIARYDIYANNQKMYSTTNLSFTVGNLDSLVPYTFYVKAVDKAGNVSPSSNQVIGYTHRQGLNYKYYNGSYSNLPNFNNLTPVKSGVTDTVNAGNGIRTQDDNFALKWEANIYIPVTGTWTFETASDDGSRLYIDVPYSSGATPLIDNDGAHSLTSKSASKYLTQGYHSIVITYAEVGGDNFMDLYWSNAMGLARERLPKGFFAIGDYGTSTMLNAPGSFTAIATSYNKIQLTWTDNSNNEAGFEISRATAANGTFTPIATTGSNAVTYTDTALTPATTYYYKIRAISANGESVYKSAFTEGNWKLDNNYNEANGGSSLDPSSTSFTTDRAEGSHAVTFDNSDYISFSGSSSAFPSAGGYSQRTVALWIKPSATNNKRIVWEFGGNDNGMALRFNSDDLVGGIASGSSRSTVTLSNFTNNSNWIRSQWNHVALVYDVNSLTMYLNGVQVAQTTSLPFTSVGNSSNASRIGRPSATSNSNTTVFNDNPSGYSNYSGSMDNLYIINGALGTEEINAIRNNTFNSSSAKTLAAPAPPSTPNGVTANVLSTNAVYLAWNDNSSNETGFEIWRSSGDKSNNRVVATVPGGAGSQKNFTDTTLFANVTYYYKVRALGEVSPSGYSAEVSAKTLNTKPVIKKIVNFTMKYGTTFTLPISATDADGDVLTFTTQNLPTFATIENVSNGNINLVFSPPVSRRGTYPLRVIVNDGNNGKDTTTFTMVVNTNDVPVMTSISDVNIDEGGEASISFSATDNNGTGKMVWSFEGMPPFATFTNNNDGSGKIDFKPGYSSSGEYELTVTVDDGFGAWTANTIKVTVADREPEETVQFNFRSQSAAVLGWNSVTVAAGNFTHGTIVNTKLNVSTMALSLVSGSVNASTLGPQSNDNTGVYPNLVMHDIMTWGFSLTTNKYDTIVMKVSGLDVTKKYDFVFYGGYFINGNATSVVRFKIGDDLATVNYYQNVTMTDTISDVVPSAAGEVLITMIGDPNLNWGGVLNAMVVKSNYDDGSTPARPINFTGEHLQNTGVQLNWEDRAFNESGYKVFRSLTRNGSYEQLNPGATNVDATSFADSTVAPETTYYYYVAGFNGRGDGASSDTIQVKTGNNKPVIALGNDIYAKTDNVLNVDFPVTDDAGDVVNVAIEGNPSFVKLQNQGGSNYRIVVNATTDHIGWYTATLKATDQKGAVAVKTVNISVSDKNTRSVYVNYGSVTKTAPAPWNNFLGNRTANSTLANLKDETNTATPFSVTMVSSWSGVSDLGHLTGNNSGAAPDSVLQSGISDGAGPKTIRISGLDDSKRYNIVFIASQNEGTNATVEYASGTTKDTLNARYNTNQTGNLNGLTSVGGQITVVATRVSGGTTNLLNGLVIEEYDPSIEILNPVNMYAETVDKTTIDVSWSDRAANEDATQGYLLERATDSLFSHNLVVIPLPGNTTTYRNTGLTPNIRYWYRVRARAAGGTFSEYSNRAKATTPASTVLVNFNYTMPDADFPWNNTFSSPSFEASFEGLTNETGANSGITLWITKIFNGEFTAGVYTGNNSGVVPDKALVSDYWIDNTQESQMKISGLNHTRRYRIGFYGSSSSNGWFKGNYTATYTVNGKTVYLNSWMNSSKIVYLDDLVPDENGELLLDFSTTKEAQYGFNGGIIIQDYTIPEEVTGGTSSSPSVVQPSAVDEGTNNDDQSAARTQAETFASRVYPNPFTDFVNLDFNNESENNRISIEVYDLSGRIGYRRMLGQLPKGGNTVRLNAAEAGLKTGVYIITLSVNGKPVQASKVIRLENQ